MAIKHFQFNGTVSWLNNRQDEKFKKYNFQFYPADANTRRAIKDTGIKNGLKEDKDGQFYYTFWSAEPIAIRGVPEGKLLANGSGATVNLEVEDFVSQKWGRVVKSKVTGVTITEFIEFVPDPEKAKAEDTDSPLPV